MLRKTLTTTASSCLALAANADSGQYNPLSALQNPVGGKHSSVEALDIPLITK